jgi:hypothetical protein
MFFPSCFSYAQKHLGLKYDACMGVGLRDERSVGFQTSLDRMCHDFWLLKKIKFWANADITLYNKQTMHIKSSVNNGISVISKKNLMPWRDSNPGRLILRRTFGHCKPLPHETMLPRHRNEHAQDFFNS